MSAALFDALSFALFGGTLFALLLACAIAAVGRQLLRRLTAVAPQPRAQLLLALLLVPLAGGAIYAVITLVSAMLIHDSPLLAGICASHGASIWHACVWHSTETGGGDTWTLLIAAVVVGVILAGRSMLVMRRCTRAIDALARLSRREHGALVIDSAQPLAVAAGIDSRVLISQALIDRLDARQLRIVLAHELAHVVHRDVLRRWLAGTLSRLHLPRTRRRLLAALDLAVEQRCDRVAADVVGDPLEVADTLVTVERIYARHPSPVPVPVPFALPFAQGMVDARVHALLAPSTDDARGILVLLVAAVVGIGAAAHGLLHHVTEFVLTRLFT